MNSRLRRYFAWVLVRIVAAVACREVDRRPWRRARGGGSMADPPPLGRGLIPSVTKVVGESFRWESCCHTPHMRRGTEPHAILCDWPLSPLSSAPRFVSFLWGPMVELGIHTVAMHSYVQNAATCRWFGFEFGSRSVSGNILQRILHKSYKSQLFGSAYKISCTTIDQILAPIVTNPSKVPPPTHESNGQHESRGHGGGLSRKLR